MASDIVSDEYNSFEDDYADSEDASETGIKEEHTEIKEQMYREKRDQIKHQIQQLHAGTLPEFCKRQKRLELGHKDRQKRIHSNYNFLSSKFDREQAKEREAVMKEWEKKKQDLKLSLIADLEEKSKLLESERQNTDLNSTISSNTESKVHTRKLRRRANEPAPAANEKRRKEGPSSINYELTSEEIDEDLKLILAASSTTASTQDSSSRGERTTYSGNDCRIENGKLWSDRTWFHVSSPCILENHRDSIKFNAVILNIQERELSLRRVSDQNKYRILLHHLVRGRFSVKKRSNL